MALYITNMCIKSFFKFGGLLFFGVVSVNYVHADTSSLRGDIAGMVRVESPARPSYDVGMLLLVSDKNWTSVPANAVLSLPSFLEDGVAVDEAPTKSDEASFTYQLIQSTRGLPVSTDYLDLDQFFAANPDGIVKVSVGGEIPEFEIDKLYVRVNEAGTPISEDLK